MTMPIRLQRSRKKGFKLESPNGLPIVCVTRGTEFGNPFIVGRDGSAQECIEKYINSLTPYKGDYSLKSIKNCDMDAFTITAMNKTVIKTDLAGKNLACYCKVGDPCHADWLLEIANE